MGYEVAIYGKMVKGKQGSITIHGQAKIDREHNTSKPDGDGDENPFLCLSGYHLIKRCKLWFLQFMN